MLRSTTTQAILGFSLAISCGIALAAKGCEWYIDSTPTETTKTSSNCKKTKRQQCSELVHDGNALNEQSDIRDGPLRNNLIPIASVQKLQQAFEEENNTNECIRTRYREFISGKPVQGDSSPVLFKEFPFAEPYSALQDDKVFERVKTRLELELSEVQHSDETANVTYSDPAPSMPAESIPKMDSTAAFPKNLSHVNNMEAKSPTTAPVAPVESPKVVEHKKEETGSQTSDKPPRHDRTQGKMRGMQRGNWQKDMWTEYNRDLARRILSSTLEELGMDSTQ